MSNIWHPAVTDRSQADVDRLKELFAKGDFQKLTALEQAELLKDSKGALNSSDILRINGNIRLLADVLEINISISTLPSIPTQEYFDEIIRNVKAIRDCNYIYVKTPAVPSAPLNTYQKWNDLEQILADTYNILMNNFHYYAGEQLYAGDSTALLL